MKAKAPQIVKSEKQIEPAVFKGVVRDKATGKLKLIKINEELKVNEVGADFLTDEIDKVKEIRGKHFIHHIRNAIIASDVGKSEIETE